jgi:hypothetical protein
MLVIDELIMLDLTVVSTAILEDRQAGSLAAVIALAA